MLIPVSHLVVAAYVLVVTWGVRRVVDFRGCNGDFEGSNGIVSERSGFVESERFLLLEFGETYQIGITTIVGGVRFTAVAECRRAFS